MLTVPGGSQMKPHRCVILWSYICIIENECWLHLGFLLLLKHLWLMPKSEGWEKLSFFESTCLFHFTQLTTPFLSPNFFFPPSTITAILKAKWTTLWIEQDKGTLGVSDFPCMVSIHFHTVKANTEISYQQRQMLLSYGFWWNPNKEVFYISVCQDLHLEHWNETIKHIYTTAL